VTSKAAIGAQYGKAMYEEEGLLTTWLPDLKLRVGDVVSRNPKTGVLSVETTIAELHPEDLAALQNRSGPEQLYVQRGVTLDGSARGGAAGTSGEIRLTKSDSFLFAGTDGSSTAYGQLGAAREALLKLHFARTWQPKWHLIVSIRRFRRCAILIARSDDVTATVATAGGAVHHLTAIDLAAAISVTHGDAAKWDMTDAVPLFEALTVRESAWTGRSRVEERYLDDADAKRDDVTVVRSGPADQQV
jgi:hypothetical protein